MATIKGGCTSYAHVQNVRTGTKHPTSNLRRIGHQGGLSRAGSSMKKIMIEGYDEDYQCHEDLKNGLVEGAIKILIWVT